MKASKILSFFALATLLLAFMVLLSSCDDEETLSTEELLTAQPWTITELNIVVTNAAFPVPYTIDGMEEMPDCNKDDLLVFSEGGDFQVEDNEAECQAGGGVTATGSWSIQDDADLQLNSTYLSDLIEDAVGVQGFGFEEESFTLNIARINSEVLDVTYAESYTYSESEWTIELAVSFDAVSE